MNERQKSGWLILAVLSLPAVPLVAALTWLGFRATVHGVTFREAWRRTIETWLLFARGTP